MGKTKKILFAEEIQKSEKSGIQELVWHVLYECLQTFT